MGKKKLNFLPLLIHKSFFFLDPKCRSFFVARNNKCTLTVLLAKFQIVSNMFQSFCVPVVKMMIFQWLLDLFNVEFLIDYFFISSLSSENATKVRSNSILSSFDHLLKSPCFLLLLTPTPSPCPSTDMAPLWVF